MYLASWQIFLMGIIVGMFITIIFEIIIIFTKFKPVVVRESDEEEKKNGKL